MPNNKKNKIQYRPINNFTQKIKTCFFIFLMYISRYSKSKKNVNKLVTFIDEDYKFSLELNMNEYTQASFYYNIIGNEHETLVHEIKSCKRKNTFVDIGSNVGFYSLLASHYFNEVVAFEPIPEIITRFQKNISLSNKNNIQIFSYGVSNLDGTGEIVENPLNQGGNSLNLNEKEKLSHFEYDHLELSDFKKHEIKLTTLDSFIESYEKNDIDFIKIDVEGHEIEVIQGAIKTIQQFKPVIFCEISEHNFDDIKKLLSDIYLVINPLTMSEICDNTNWNFSNVLFLPKIS